MATVFSIACVGNASMIGSRTAGNTAQQRGIYHVALLRFDDEGVWGKQEKAAIRVIAAFIRGSSGNAYLERNIVMRVVGHVGGSGVLLGLLVGVA